MYLIPWLNIAQLAKTQTETELKQDFLVLDFFLEFNNLVLNLLENSNYSSLKVETVYTKIT